MNTPYTYVIGLNTKSNENKISRNEKKKYMYI